MKYWNSNRKSCEHVEPREDWKESIELWIDWMEAIGRTEETLRTRWYQIVHFSKIVNKSITDVTEDDLIFYLAGMGSSADTQGQKVVVRTSYMGESLMPSVENIRE
ncbi:integrase [Bifidobacterium breve]|uniref:integrase n=1 Tax=Bifidobacterium breve TaxID=1685 RepID=UPI0022E72CA9|nr:integrase [Bifidobacterium breve]MDX5145750.1 integrase [Bifidobacterium breve]